MTPEELMILKEAVKNMREGNLTGVERVIFVIGIQAGLYSDDKVVKKLLNEVADMCIYSADEVDSVIKTFNN